LSDSYFFVRSLDGSLGIYVFLVGGFLFFFESRWFLKGFGFSFMVSFFLRPGSFTFFMENARVWAVDSSWFEVVGGLGVFRAVVFFGNFAYVGHSLFSKLFIFSAPLVVALVLFP